MAMAIEQGKPWLETKLDQGQVAKGQLVARTSSTTPAQQQSLSDKMMLFGKNLLEIVLLYQQIEAFLVKQAILCDKNLQVCKVWES